MAIKKLTSDDDDSGMIPLASEYLKKNPTELGKMFPVLEVGFSRNGDWLMLDTDSFRVMYQKKSKQASELVSLFKEIHLCEADQIVAVLHKTKKGNGAFIASNSDERREYHWDGEILQIMALGESHALNTSSELTAIGFNAKPLEVLKSLKSTAGKRSEQKAP